MPGIKDFRDKIVVITGAGSGIGRATALAFASEGAKVVLSDISEERLKEVKEVIERKGAGALTYKKEQGTRFKEQGEGTRVKTDIELRSTMFDVRNAIHETYTITICSLAMVSWMSPYFPTTWVFSIPTTPFPGKMSLGSMAIDIPSSSAIF